MTFIQFLILVLILAAGVILISEMMHYVKAEEITIADCQQMYSNLTLMDLCYEKFAQEIDP